MIYDLLIVGNGFDIGSGFRTTYKDYLYYEGMKGYGNPLISYFVSANNNNFFENEEWNSFEKLFCNYLEFINYLFTNETNVESHFTPLEDNGSTLVHRYFVLHIKNASKIPHNVRNVLSLSNPLNRVLLVSLDADFRLPFPGFLSAPNQKEIFFKIWINCEEVNANKKIVLKNVLDALEGNLVNLEKGLNAFIKEKTAGTTNGPVSFIGNTAKSVISFNYSKTAERLFNLDAGNVAYVHGSIDSDAIIGVEPSMITEQSFDEKSDFIRFFKRYRRVYKESNTNYNKKIIDKLGKDSKIAIYGHSLDLSDVSILKPLFEKRYAQYDIYCYKDVDPYKIKLVKLIGLDLYSELEEDGKINLFEIN